MNMNKTTTTTVKIRLDLAELITQLRNLRSPPT